MKNSLHFLTSMASVLALAASQQIYAAEAAEPLHDLAAIEQSLMQGQAVSAAVDLSQCTPGLNAAANAPHMKGGLRVSPFLILPDSTLAFSDNHFTLDRDGNPILQFLRYRISKDGKVDFSLSTFTLPAYQQQGQTVSYICALSAGLNIYRQ
jgi:hypothetical protein